MHEHVFGSFSFSVSLKVIFVENFVSFQLPRISVMKKNLLKHLGQEESDDETEDDEVNQIVQPDTSFTLVLEVMGLMCDGQFKSMQDYLRDQPGSYKVEEHLNSMKLHCSHSQL